MDRLEMSNYTVCAALAAPHLLYAYIWFLPRRWMALFGKNSCKMFETVAWLLKVVQALGVSYWYLLRRPSGIDLAAVPPLAWIAFALLVGFGQWLNVGIFKAIGHAGVYYGFKLGHTVPWVSGFPFNVVSHPQYVGSVATVLGGAALVWTQAPQGLGLLTLYWTLLYVATAIQEDKCHVD
ncbi:hypothetical protein ABPG75_006096 [Micractinium tetrahymenae]